ncbi:DUF1329 domain-containing protein [Myxococcota bacterium]|nr:DUF1329 domain-containing protein [Myxococcota bacterium]
MGINFLSCTGVRGLCVFLGIFLGVVLVPSDTLPHDISGCGCTTLRAAQVTVESKGVALELFLTGSKNHTEPIHLKNPPRLVVDLPGAVSLLSSEKFEVGTKDLARVRIGQHPTKVRLVLDAGSSASALRRARVISTDRGLAFLVGDVDPPTPVQIAAPAPPPAAVRQAAPQVAAVRPSASPPPPPPQATGQGGYQTVMNWLSHYQGTQPTFSPGDVIRQGDLEKARPFLPPGYFEKFNFPEIEIEIQETLDTQPHNSYTQASFQYGGQTGLAADGAITNFIAGQPFSDERIMAASPEDAGLMVAWNNIYRWQYTGYFLKGCPMVYLGPGEGGKRDADIEAGIKGGGHVVRSMNITYQRVYMSHLSHLGHQDYAIDVRDAKKYHWKEWMEFTEPFEMRGASFVVERSRDPRALDQVNSYLPTERRVRRLSAKERSDGFAGSEMTMDDYEGFSGRPLDYEWKFIGKKKVLYVQDSKRPHSQFYGPLSDVPSDRWQLRDTYVVESRPLYEGHPYGKKITFFDAQTFNVAANVIMDKEDRFLKIFYTIYKSLDGDPAGKPEEVVTQWRSTVAQNLLKNISTVTWGTEVETPVMKASKVRRLFSVSNLTGGR